MNNKALELRVTEIGEFIRHNSCARRLKLEINNKAEARKLPFFDRLFNPLDPILQQSGTERAQEWELALQKEGFQSLAGDGGEESIVSWAEFSSAICNVSIGENIYARELEVSCIYGKYRLLGRIDFALLYWDQTTLKLKIAECKASRRDRTYHRIQIALYKLIVTELLRKSPLKVEVNGQLIDENEIEYIVARIDETTNKGQDILGIDGFDLALEMADIEKLLSTEGAISHITKSDLDDLPYRIEPKCDGCVFNTNCLPESARRRRLELLGLQPSIIRVLKLEGISSIDELANLDSEGSSASRIKAQAGFTENIEHLIVKAKARLKNLPAISDPAQVEFAVQSLPQGNFSQLPEHTIHGQRLVRVYLSVDYDYVENRIGALAAHITTSEREVVTAWDEQVPRPGVFEKGEARNIRLENSVITEIASSPWTGNYDHDCGIEKAKIENFFRNIVLKISAEAQRPHAPVHLYVWNRSEITHLVEACARLDTGLLGHLNQLLGCREKLEQLVYSVLQDEVRNRFATGWTGQGLGVVVSLTWFGQRYHWRRLINGKSVDLDQVFTQDLFDFKTDLEILPDGNWADDSRSAVRKEKFEIRSRFFDNLPAPYWRAYWNVLPQFQETSIDPRVSKQLQRYARAAQNGVLEGYLESRVHALR